MVADLVAIKTGRAVLRSRRINDDGRKNPTTNCDEYRVMANVSYLSQSIALAFLTLLVWAAISDMRSYRIPNIVPAGLIALYPLHLVASATLPNWLGGLWVALAVFAVGFGLFAAKWLGGGDVKLLTAVALWAGPDQILDCLVLTGLAGGAFSLLLWLPRRLQARLAMVSGWIKPPASSMPRIPYGVAIAAGAGAVGVPLITG
jgi:prepilin peptidase CpaA